MKKKHISFNNYLETIALVNITALPDILQKGHHFFLEAHLFYRQEPIIKETIDIYLKQLNIHLSTAKKEPKQNALVSNAFITDFLRMHRTIITKDELKTFILKLQKAVSDKEITKNDLHASQIEKIQSKLIGQYNNMGGQASVQIMINNTWRSTLLKKIKIVELNGIDIRTSNEVEKLPISHSKKDGLFTSFDQQPIQSSTPTFQLQGAMGKLLGDLEKFELAITIEGDQGGGKTRFTYQMADAFAEVGNDVAIFTLEIGSKSDLINRMNNEYLTAKNRHRISRADHLPNGYKTIENAAKTFDVIIIDSWNKTGLHSQDFDRLRKENPDTIFIVIFQRTTGKTIRGGTAPLFDAGINIEVVKADNTFENNYAITTKNRYGVTGIKYNIFHKDITDADNVTPALKKQN